MKRKRYIGWILLLASIVMLVASVLPHHHHQEFLCLLHDIPECQCSCADASCHQDGDREGGHHCCNAHCVTKFNSVIPDRVQDDVPPLYSFCSLLYLNADVWLFSAQAAEVRSRYYFLYLEKLHSTCLPHVKGLRAPPRALA